MNSKPSKRPPGPFSNFSLPSDMRRLRILNSFGRIGIGGQPWGWKGGGGIVDPLAAYIVFDTFTDVDGTLLTAHVPEKDALGLGWQPYPTSYTIQGNKAASPIQAGRQYNAIDAGQADLTMECDVTFPNPAKTVGLIGRLQSAQVCWFYVIHSSLAAQIFKDNAGFTMIASSAAFAVPGTTYRLRVVLIGNSHSFYVDDILKASVPNDAFLATETEFGLWVNGGTGAERWDNFSLRP